MLMLVGVALTFSARLLLSAYTTHSHSLDRLRCMQQLALASNQFYGDAREAISVVANEESLVFACPNNKVIRYDVSKQCLQRTLTQGESVVKTDSWEAPEIARAEWLVEQVEQFYLGEVRLWVENSANPSQPITWVGGVGSRTLNETNSKSQSDDSDTDTSE